MRLRNPLMAGFCLAALPAAAMAAPLSIGDVVGGAMPLSKALLAGLVICMLAAVAICLRKLASGPNLAGGSPFLSGLRIGGPVAGLLGGALGILNICIGLANVAPGPPLSVLARGWAEAIAMVAAGMLCGLVAVIANWAVEAQVDRRVLRP